MKPFELLIFLTLFSLIAKSQEYSFLLYFEDSIGNRDTLYFGFDKEASFGIDEKFGETNIIGNPYDSILFAFFSDAATNEEYDCRLETEKNPTYITKKQYINLLNEGFIEIGLIAKNWPIKISWDQNAIADFDINKYLGLSDHGLFLTSFRPLNGYPDSFCCGEWPTSTGLTWLSGSSQVQIAKENVCLYQANSMKDSISLIYIGQMYKYTSVNDFSTNSIYCWYDKYLDVICIRNLEVNLPLKIEVFNIQGIKIMEEQVQSDNSNPININTNYLPCGLYITRISTLKDKFLKSTLKIIKR